VFLLTFFDFDSLEAVDFAETSIAILFSPFCVSGRSVFRRRKVDVNGQNPRDSFAFGGFFQREDKGLVSLRRPRKRFR